VKLAVVSIGADTFLSQVSATDAEVASYFDAHQNDFKSRRRSRSATCSLMWTRCGRRSW